jgi:hypothetical protein
MRFFNNSIILIVGILVLSGCSRDDFNFSKIASTTLSNLGEKVGSLSLGGIGEQIGIKNEALVRLPPAPLPIYAVGDTFVYSSSGRLVQEQVVSASDERVTWTNDQGMIWTTTNDLITPPMSWSSHPELGRGRQTIIGNPASIFPLKKGNKVAFGVRGNSENLPTGWRHQQSCEVLGQKDINVTAGDFITFHISCKRKDYKEDLYYSPLAQNYVLRAREYKNTKSEKQLVSVALGNNRTKNIAAKLNRPTKERINARKKIKIPGKVVKKANIPSSGNPEVDALIVKLESMIKRFESTSTSKEKPKKEDKVGSGNTGKYGVHLASYRSEKGAKRGWKTLKKKFARELKELDFGTTEFDAGKGKGTFVRLMGLGFETKSAANKFCKRLKKRRQYCKGERARP